MAKARHARPSIRRKVTKAAGIAALPAITSVVMATSAHAATAAPERVQAKAQTTAAIVQIVPPVTVRDLARTEAQYTVVSGDTLSGIAQDRCGSAGDWPSIYNANKSVIGGDPNLIYPGQDLTLDCSQAAVIDQTTNTDPPKSDPPPPVQTASQQGPQASGGTLGCQGLENLWDAAGGNPGDAFLAAEIAMAESGGQQYAVSPSDDYGYWQINMPSWGPGMATFSPVGNAKAAIQISQDGTDWNPWTTYTGGLYEGKC